MDGRTDGRTDGWMDGQVSEGARELQTQLVTEHHLMTPPSFKNKKNMTILQNPALARPKKTETLMNYYPVAILDQSMDLEGAMLAAQVVQECHCLQR